MRTGLGPIVIVAALWGAVAVHHGPAPAQTNPPLPRGCTWRQDPAVRGGAVCATGLLARLFPPLGAGQRLALGLRVDVNSATAPDLRAVPGIGPRTAQAIVEQRQRRGGYRELDDLARVRGLGPGQIDKLRPYLRAGRLEVQ